jgi:hypothetical protein
MAAARCDDARMSRRLLTMTGALLAGAGLAAAVASLAVPWGRYRVKGSALGGIPLSDDGPMAVFQVAGGNWYLLAIGVLAGLLAIAALGTGRAQQAALTIAPVTGILTVLIVLVVANNVASSAAGVGAVGLGELRMTGETAAGVPLGLLAGPLLGFGTGLVALARRRGAESGAASPTLAG